MNEVAADELILDIGPDTAERCCAIVASAGTMIWNGPVGVFEFDQFGEGTRVDRQRDRQQQGVFAGRRRRHAGGD